ncbi:Diguanylate Cyclase and Two-component system sensory domain-containing protein [Natronoarchaeum philippinense]|uniref:Diguanylate Cyclase and Two-component system sensory domain-containing protein n=1 Tax=Natronoarchaeum philippinense TaxID=558529 RepID=A0A285NTN3_NATPI|nr:DICT sensory domain-containing protein [Natronoarchaeum philippinense]SNZ12377.1 Diguanylate Cyclase and Two-component system sensory domain-containing protein [Natronoarchaeum philippinense]
MGSDDANGQTDADEFPGRATESVLAALTEPRRQYVLYYLRERERADLATLSWVVAGWLGADSDAGVTSGADHDRLELELHHNHLPHLDDIGLIEYDPNTHDVRLTQPTELVADLLDRIGGPEPSADYERRPVADARTSMSSLRTTDGIDSLRDLVEDVEQTATTITVCAPDASEALLDQFVTRNVEIEHESLPAVADGGFVLVQRNGVTLGTIGLDVLERAATSPTAPPGERSDEDYRQFLSLFRDTQFTTASRGELLKTAREIEDRAWRTGEGRLRTGFQSLSAYQDQLSVYRRLGTESDLDVHVYGRPDWTPPAIEGVRLHESTGAEIGLVWFVVFHDGRDDATASGRSNSCALIAEERARDQYYGFWTYDPELVAAIDDYLASTYR